MLDEKGSDLAERIRKVFRDRSGHDPTEDVPLYELSERWDFLKGTKTEDFQSAYFNSEAGWCDAAGATASLMAATEKRGVKRVTADVTELVFDANSKQITGVRTADGQHFTADKILLATGAWTSSLLSPIEDSLDIGPQDRIECQVQATGRVSAYYKMSEQEVQRLSNSKMPVVVYGQSGEVIPPSNENRLLKYSTSKTVTNTIKTESGQVISIPPPDQDQYCVPESLKHETENVLVSRCLPELVQGKQADYWRICWDAQTPTEDWLMCKHPDQRLENLYIATGGSFHSYKYVNSEPRDIKSTTAANIRMHHSRFLPNAGMHMVNVLNGKGNGAEKDKAWGWKPNTEWKDAPHRELKDLEEDTSNSIDKAKL